MSCHRNNFMLCRRLSSILDEQGGKLAPVGRGKRRGSIMTASGTLLAASRLKIISVTLFMLSLLCVAGPQLYADFDESQFVDCSDKSVGAAEEHYYEKVRQLTIDLDQWSRLPHRFDKKIKDATRKRQIYFKRWLEVVCRCKKGKLDSFDKSLCLAAGLTGVVSTPANQCLIIIK